MNIVEYDNKYKEAVINLMAQLQDYERALSAERPPGGSIAEGHFNYLLNLCENQSGKIFLALHDEMAIGFIIVLVESEDDGDLVLYTEQKIYGLVTDLFVQESHRGSDTANDLLERAEEHCASLGLSIMRISVLHSNNVARHFYEKSGYETYEVIYRKRI